MTNNNNQEPFVIKGIWAKVLIVSLFWVMWYGLSGCATSAQTYVPADDSAMIIPMYLEDVSFGCLECMDATHIRGDHSE